METQPNIADAVRGMMDAYGEAWLNMTKFVAGLPKHGDGPPQRVTEEWLRVARMMKDSLVAAVNQGFDLWEAECRRVLGALPSEGLGTPLGAVVESWRRTLDAFSSTSKLGGVWGDEAQKQVDLVQRMLQEGFDTWLRLCRVSERKS